MVAGILVEISNRNVDKIFVINEGQVVESGTFEELMNKNGLFTKMWDEYNKSVEWKIVNKKGDNDDN